MMNPCHLVISGLVIIVGFSCDWCNEKPIWFYIL